MRKPGIRAFTASRRAEVTAGCASGRTADRRWPIRTRELRDLGRRPEGEAPDIDGECISGGGREVAFTGQVVLSQLVEAARINSFGEMLDASGMASAVDASAAQPTRNGCPSARRTVQCRGHWGDQPCSKTDRKQKSLSLTPAQFDRQLTR